MHGTSFQPSDIENIIARTDTWLSRLALLSHDLHTCNSSQQSAFSFACHSTLNAVASVFAEDSKMKEVVSLTGDCVYSVLRLCISILMRKIEKWESIQQQEERQGEIAICHTLLVR